mgnify:CR=1 FL=1
MATKIIKLFDKNNLENYHYETSYKVSCLDGVWLCDCALEHNRNIKKHCKHIKEIIKKNEEIKGEIKE